MASIIYEFNASEHRKDNESQNVHEEQSFSFRFATNLSGNPPRTSTLKTITDRAAAMGWNVEMTMDDSPPDNEDWSDAEVVETKKLPNK